MPTGVLRLHEGRGSIYPKARFNCAASADAGPPSNCCAGADPGPPSEFRRVLERDGINPRPGLRFEVTIGQDATRMAFAQRSSTDDAQRLCVPESRSLGACRT